MSRFVLTRTVSHAESTAAREANVRLHVLVGPATSSSSSGEPLSLSSDQAIFLNGTDSHTRFLGVCSPIDMAVFGLDVDEITNRVRTNEGEWDFRNEELMEQFWLRLLFDVQSLDAALTKLDELYGVVAFTVDFSPDDDPGSRYFEIIREVTFYPDDSPSHYRMRVTCEAVGGDASEIFLHRYELPDRNGEIFARPIAVCSPGDLADYPVGEPRSGQFPRYFRRAAFDVSSRNVSRIYSGWTNIYASVRLLAASLKGADSVVEITEVQI